MKLESELLNSEQQITKTIRSKIFDIISIVIIVSMVAICLGVLDWADFSKWNIFKIILQTVPYFLGSYLLGITQYEKGSTVGKQTEDFKRVAKAYSEKISDFSGKKLTTLSDFCVVYNRKALTSLRNYILLPLALTEEDLLRGGGESKKLIGRTEKELEPDYGKRGAKLIVKASNASIKGVSPNLLLGNLDAVDPTDIGVSEKDITKKRMIGYAISYWVITFLFSLVVMKDVLSWGWAGLAFAAFKIAYVIAMSYKKYIDGYKDVTTKLATHINRKTDILKEYDSWFEEKSSEQLTIDNGLQNG